MSELPIEQRLASIERRLAEIEQAIELSRTPSGEQLSAPPLVPMAPAVATVPETRLTQRVSLQGSPPPLPPLVSERRTTPPPQVQVSPIAPAPALEQTIGLKWAGW